MPVIKRVLSTPASPPARHPVEALLDVIDRSFTSLFGVSRSLNLLFMDETNIAGRPSTRI